jgi:hypothetical protein
MRWYRIEAIGPHADTSWRNEGEQRSGTGAPTAFVNAVCLSVFVLCRS